MRRSQNAANNILSSYFSLIPAEFVEITMNKYSVIPLHVFLRRVTPEPFPSAAVPIPPEILNGGRPPTAEELASWFPPMRVVLEFPDQGERYFLRVARPPMAGKAGLLWGKMKPQSALVVERDETTPSDVIILSGLKDEYKQPIRALFQKCREMSWPSRESHRRRRPKKFVPGKNNILAGGGRVNPEANMNASIARSHALLTGSFDAPEVDENSAS